MPHDEDKRPGETPPRESLPGSLRRGADYPGYLLLLATAGLFVLRLPLLLVRAFDPDELEHAHAAWCVAKGMIPYQDFFEHHTPWYYYLLSPFFRWFDVDLSFESARHFLLFGRGLSLLLAILSVVLVAVIGRVWEDRRVGVLAGFLLAGQPVFLQKTLEIRPDVLALPCLLGGLALLLSALARSPEPAGRSLRAFFFGGLGLGAAVMCTQKMLFVLPGAFAGLGLWALAGGARAALGSRLLRIAIVFLGLALPLALTWAAFALYHAGGAMIANNFLLNAGWRQVVHQQLLLVLETSWPVLVLCLLGAAVCLYWFFRSRPRAYGGFLLFCILVGLGAGILVVPVAHRQYYLILLPVICLFAAKGLTFLVDRAAERARAWLLLLATLLLLILPALGLREEFQRRDDRQLARLRHVFARTKPTDLVMDGWEGTGVFRPHAFYYYFLHEESVPMLARPRVEAFLDDLETGKVRPRLIALDENLVALGSRFLRFVKSNYGSSDGFFYFSTAGTD